MTAIMNNIKSMWSVCGFSAEGCVNAMKREFHELEKDWAEAETYWREHPEEALPVYFYN